MGEFFFSLFAWAGIFFADETLCTIFFHTNIAFLLNSEIYVFVLYKLFYTHNRSKDIGHLLTQNLFQNVHTVREEEATWGGRLPCTLLQSLPSGIPLPQPIIMIPFAINQNSPSVVPSTPKCQSKQEVPV